MNIMNPKALRDPPRYFGCEEIHEKRINNLLWLKLYFLGIVKMKIYDL